MNPPDVSPVTPIPPCLVATTGQQLLDDIVVKELPCISTDRPDNSHTDLVIYTALLARIEVLEAENKKLQVQLGETKHSEKSFRLEDIQGNDELICFYTGFASFRIFEAFYEFLGPATQHLNYWGERESSHKRKRSRILDKKTSYS